MRSVHEEPSVKVHFKLVNVSGHACMHGCMNSNRGTKRPHKRLESQSGQLDIRSCFTETVKDHCLCIDVGPVPRKKRVLSHVGQTIAAACNDHHIKELSEKKRMCDEWCQMVIRCARRPRINSMHDVASGDKGRKLYDGLNSAQKEAVNSPSSHALVILAGAGTGKTTTLLARTEYLLQNGARPENVLILTFSNKSAQDIVERLVPSLGLSVAQRLVCTTIHSFCWALIRCFYYRLDLH